MVIPQHCFVSEMAVTWKFEKNKPTTLTFCFPSFFVCFLLFLVIIMRVERTTLILITIPVDLYASVMIDGNL